MNDNVAPLACDYLCARDYHLARALSSWPMEAIRINDLPVQSLMLFDWLKSLVPHIKTW